MEIARAKQEVIEAGNRLAALGLAARTWGNVSCRIDEQTFAITPSGLAYERLNESNIVVLNTKTLAYEGKIKPSSEKAIHANAYRLDPDIGFVIHTHQTYATCVSVAGFSRLRPDQKESSVLGGPIGLGSYALPSTKKLARVVSAQIARGRRAILMQSHGALLTGQDREEAFIRALTLEAVCRRSMPGLPAMNDSPSQPDRAAQRVIARIQDHISAYQSILLLNSQAIRAAMEKTDVLPAVLDDFAQIAGSDMQTALAGSVIQKLKNRNVVYLKGVGALCCANNESDAQAIMTLTEKNALAFLNAYQSGEPAALSFWDKKIMRYVYLKKYAKKK